MSTVLELLQDAALVLAQHGSVKDRLLTAYCTYLSSLDAALLPKEYREDYARLCAALHRERPQPRENVVRASVRKMSYDEANEYAALLVRIYGAVARSSSAGKRANTGNIAPVVQLFAGDR